MQSRTVIPQGVNEVFVDGLIRGGDTDGSVLKGTVQASTVDFTVEFDVESDDPPERVAACIRAAEAGCFVMQAITKPTEVTRRVTLNGADFDIEA